MLARFMARYHGVTLHLRATNRRVDVVGEGVDVAIRVRPRPIEDSDTVMRVLADRGHQLVASPDLISRLGRPQAPSELSAGRASARVRTSISINGSSPGRRAERKCISRREW